MKNSSAFTLIELLVVVLIIGILAAVAVPQYQLAVAKSRAVQLQTRFNALQKAARLYALGNGEWPTDVRELDIDIANDNVTYAAVGLPITGNTSHTGAIYSNGDKCAVFVNLSGVNNGNVNPVISCGNEDLVIVEQPLARADKILCVALTKSGEKICKGLSGGRISGSEEGELHRYILD